MNSSIIKLDRPYPVVLYKGSLYLHVGTLFTFDSIEKKDYTGRCQPTRQVQKAFPVLSDESGQFGMPICTMELQDCVSVCKENATVTLSKLKFFLIWRFEELTDANKGVFPRWVDYNLMTEVEKYGCVIQKRECLEDEDIVIDLQVSEDSRGHILFSTQDYEEFFLFTQLLDADVMADDLFQGIDFYRQFLKNDTINWSFTIDRVEYQPLLEKVNSIIKKRLTWSRGENVEKAK